MDLWLIYENTAYPRRTKAASVLDTLSLKKTENRIFRFEFSVFNLNYNRSCKLRHQVE